MIETQVEFYIGDADKFIVALRSDAVPRAGEFINISKVNYRVIRVAWAVDRIGEQRMGERRMRANVELELDDRANSALARCEDLQKSLLDEMVRAGAETTRLQGALDEMTAAYTAAAFIANRAQPLPLNRDAVVTDTLDRVLALFSNWRPGAWAHQPDLEAAIAALRPASPPAELAPNKLTALRALAERYTFPRSLDDLAEFHRVCTPEFVLDTLPPAEPNA